VRSASVEATGELDHQRRWQRERVVAGLVAPAFRWIGMRWMTLNAPVSPIATL
jgi:hypothetical protein